MLTVKGNIAGKTGSATEKLQILFSASIANCVYFFKCTEIMDFSVRWTWYKMKVLDEYSTAPMSVSLDRVRQKVTLP
jgi:hypothetical protein